MRVVPLALAALSVLAAGCLTETGGPLPGEGGPTPPSPAPPPGSFVDCPRVEILAPRQEIVTASRAQVDYRVTNCAPRAVTFEEAGCGTEGGIVVTLTRGDLTLYAYGNSEPRDTPFEPSCDEAPHLATIAPGESILRPAFFNGGYTRCEEGVCPFQSHWASPGNWSLVVTFRDVDNRTSLARGSVEFLSPVLPGFDEESDLVLLVNDTYRVGDVVAVRVQNRGEVTYGYSTFYAACGTGFYDAEAYPFKIPPGTHCDISNTSPLAPGETATLFTWSLDRCTKDVWGCAASEPLAPGEYHVRVTLGEYREGPSSNSDGKVARLGWAFTIVA